MNQQVYQPKEMVRIRSGAFASFSGEVERVDNANQMIKVSIEILGRKTMVALPISEVEKDSRGSTPPLTSLN